MTYLSPSLWALRTPCRSYQETISWLYQWKVYLLIFPFFAGHLFCHYLDTADWEIVNMINSSYSGIKNAWNECAERIQIKHVKQFCGRFSELVLSHNLLASKPHLEAYVLTQGNSMGFWGYKLVCFTTRSKKTQKETNTTKNTTNRVWNRDYDSMDFAENWWAQWNPQSLHMCQVWMLCD